MTTNSESSTNVEFTKTSKAQEAGHTIAITANGIPYSHCHNKKICDNELGELGRIGNPSIPLPIKLVHANANTRNTDDNDVRTAHAYTGGFPSSGHSAVLDTHGNLWLSGCDRWQQLGMGSSNGGSSGYTWKGGRLWQDHFQKNQHVVDLLRRLDPMLGTNGTDGKPLSVTQSSSSVESGAVDSSRRWIRDVALGGDHTVLLSSNRKDVIVFGKGGENQLGLSSKPWVSSPAKSKVLSSASGNISAVCAFRNCSMTLDADGQVMSKAGKCSLELKGMTKALDLCRKRAKETGLNS
mmetsp:Transcript_4489/g.10054  ORF Transcript_4489/g.10054 Transcript_4489/m.10054 type:complete len:295 (-) Transcript_4489:78-962(-)